MKFNYMLLLMFLISSCTHSQKANYTHSHNSRVLANSERDLVITIPKSEFISVGATRSNQRMKDGNTWTKWQRFIINETQKRIDAKASISCAI